MVSNADSNSKIYKSNTKSSTRKRGFQVGPEHLPDGSYRRHTQKIKKALIEKAKTRKRYAKIRERELGPTKGNDTTAPADEASNSAADAEQQGPVPVDSAHKPDDRLPAQLNPPPTSHEPTQNNGNDVDPHDSSKEDASMPPRAREILRRRRTGPRPMRFQREAAQAASRRAEQEQRQREREEAQRERDAKLAERARARKAMAKARGPDGRRKLGRESGLLLERVRKLVKE